MYELIAEYGTTALGWILSGLGLLLAKFVWHRIGNEKVRGILERAWLEVKAAVKEVGQTYVEEVRRAMADGKLTEREKRIAKEEAVKIAKSNIGPKGLKALARALGLESVEAWLSNKVEAAVSDEKKAAKAAGAAAGPS